MLEPELSRLGPNEFMRALESAHAELSVGFPGGVASARLHLEIVLLGLRTLATRSEQRGLVGSVLIVMSDCTAWMSAHLGETRRLVRTICSAMDSGDSWAARECALALAELWTSAVRHSNVEADDAEPSRGWAFQYELTPEYFRLVRPIFSRLLAGQSSSCGHVVQAKVANTLQSLERLEDEAMALLERQAVHRCPEGMPLAGRLAMAVRLHLLCESGALHRFRAAAADADAEEGVANGTDEVTGVLQTLSGLGWAGGLSSAWLDAITRCALHEPPLSVLWGSQPLLPSLLSAARNALPSGSAALAAALHLCGRTLPRLSGDEREQLLLRTLPRVSYAATALIGADEPAAAARDAFICGMCSLLESLLWNELALAEAHHTNDQVRIASRGGCLKRAVAAVDGLFEHVNIATDLSTVAREDAAPPSPSAIFRGDARPNAGSLVGLMRFRELVASVRRPRWPRGELVARERVASVASVAISTDGRVDGPGDDAADAMVRAVLRFATSHAAHRDAAAAEADTLCADGGGRDGHTLASFLDEVESTATLASAELAQLLSMANAQLAQGRDVIYLFRSVLPKCMASVDGWDEPGSTAVRDALLSLWQAAVATRSNVMKLHAALVAGVLPRLRALTVADERVRGRALTTLLEVVVSALGGHDPSGDRIASGVPRDVPALIVGGGTSIRPGSVQRDASALLGETAAVALALQPDPGCSRALRATVCSLIAMGDEDAVSGGDWQECMLRTRDALEFALKHAADDEGRQQVHGAFRFILHSKQRLRLLKQMASVCKPALVEAKLTVELRPLWLSLFSLLESKDTHAFARLVPLLLSLTRLLDRPAGRSLHDDGREPPAQPEPPPAPPAPLAPPAPPAQALQADIAAHATNAAATAGALPPVGREEPPLLPPMVRRASSRSGRQAVREARDVEERAPGFVETAVEGGGGQGGACNSEGIAAAGVVVWPLEEREQLLRQAVEDVRDELMALLLSSHQLSKTDAQHFTGRLARISLWKAIWYVQQPLAPIGSTAEVRPEARLLNSFPAEILASESTLHALQLTGQRLQSVGEGRNPEGYAELKALVVEALQLFLSPRPSALPLATNTTTGAIGPPAMSEEALVQRTRVLRAFADALPFNRDRQPALLASGYHPELWERPVFVQVLTTARYDLEAEACKRLVSLYADCGAFSGVGDHSALCRPARGADKGPLPADGGDAAAGPRRAAGPASAGRATA